MKKAAIISVGNEILSGRVTDTNAAYLSERLIEANMPVVSGYTVPDEIPKIVRALGLACEDADIVLVTGGLGPTDDDLTRQAFADFMGVELVINEHLLQQIDSFFERRNLKMAHINRIQACIPQGAMGLENGLGTAPGILAEFKGKLLVAMPGVPSEMKSMFEEHVCEKIRQLTKGQAVCIKKLKCFGTGESNIAQMLGDMMQRQRNPLLNCTVRYGISTLHIIASAKDQKKAEQMAKKDEKILTGILGNLIYGQGDVTLAQVVGNKLAAAGKTLAVAESCTGGLIAKLLTDVPGSSKYFSYGWVTYSNQAKMTELGVSESLLSEHGAVSKQVARAMANGAKNRSGAHYSLAVTGIAGPGGAVENKPVGLVYISLDCEGKTITKRHVFSHDRNFIRFRTAQTALNMLRLSLQI